MPAAKNFTCPKCARSIRTRRAFVSHYNGCNLPIRIDLLLTLGDVDTARECWTWRGVLTGSAGYGKYGGVYAHRIACEFWGRPEDEQLALHSCDNPPCVNPAHLSWGTIEDNVRQCVARGRWNGHKGTEHWTKTKPEMNPWKRKGSERHWDAWPESRRNQYEKEMTHV